MIHQQILQEVMRRSRYNAWCAECLSYIQRHEDSFLAIRSKLTEEEQEQLDLYIGACEAWCHAHIFIAYQLGRENPFLVLGSSTGRVR